MMKLTKFLGRKPTIDKMLAIDAEHLPRDDYDELVKVANESEPVSGLNVVMVNNDAQVLVLNLEDVKRDKVKLSEQTWAILDAALADDFVWVSFAIINGEFYPNLEAFNWKL